MKIVYLLSHRIKVEKDSHSTVIIGIYTSLEIIQETIQRYKYIEGFKDYPDNFIVEEYEIDFDNYIFE